MYKCPKCNKTYKNKALALACPVCFPKQQKTEKENKIEKIIEKTDDDKTAGINPPLEPVHQPPSESGTGSPAPPAEPENENNTKLLEDDEGRQAFDVPAENPQKKSWLVEICIAIIFIVLAAIAFFFYFVVPEKEEEKV